jgi:hypothetical protein
MNKIRVVADFLPVDMKEVGCCDNKLGVGAVDTATLVNSDDLEEEDESCDEAVWEDVVGCNDDNNVSSGKKVVEVFCSETNDLSESEDDDKDDVLIG